MTNQLQQQPSRRPANVRVPAIEKFAYCLCLHVKPTTIFIAVFKLIRALLHASILLNTEFTSAEVGELGIERYRSTATAVYILTRIIMASVAAIGIYAVISGKAAFLMPLYAMLLIDFFKELPAFYNRELDPQYMESGMVDLRTYSMANNPYNRYSLMLVSTISLIVKIYFLCVIWKCYRYLRLIELVTPMRLSEIYPHMHQNVAPFAVVLGGSDSNDLSPAHNMAPPPYDSIASTMKPPNYEEAVKSSCVELSGTNPNQLNSTNNHHHQQQQPQPQQQSVGNSNQPSCPEPNHSETGTRMVYDTARTPADIIVRSSGDVTINTIAESIGQHRLRIDTATSPNVNPVTHPLTNAITVNVDISKGEVDSH